MSQLEKEKEKKNNKMTDFATIPPLHQIFVV